VRRGEWNWCCPGGGGARETDARPRLKQAGTRRSGYETPFDSSVDRLDDRSGVGTTAAQPASKRWGPEVPTPPSSYNHLFLNHF
jgi:hypothetical protein